MAAKTNWSEAIKPLLKKYKGKKHPLDYQDNYQLLVMVILSARSTDDHINNLSKELFLKFPDMNSLSRATEKTLDPLIKKIPGSRKKGAWLMKIAKELKSNENIPLTMEGLVKLPGIGRKSANVIMREAGLKAEGVMVDLHVIRVANRLGIVKSEEPEKIEKQIMSVIPEKDWGETGMAISFLGREICRPTDPMHEKCVMKKVCGYYLKQKKTLTII